MSNKVLRRRTPSGAGLEADLAAIRGPTSAVTITHPPNDITTLAEKGHTLTFDKFTAEDAYELGHLLHARLTPDPRPALISISLASGVTLFQAATGPGTSPDNESWVARKRQTVLRFGVSTWFMNCKYGGDEAAFAAKFGLGPEQAGRYAIHGGAVPVYVRGVEGIVAVVVVSGLKQHEDHGVIVDVVRENWEPLE